MIQLPFTRRSRVAEVLEFTETVVDDAERTIAQLRQRLESANHEIERCRRNHTDQGNRNSTLQATNVRLAHRCEQAEAKAFAAATQADHMGRLASTYWQQLLDHRITPLGPRPAGERT